MTAMTKAYAGAPSTKDRDWDAINWRTVEANVRRLQMRIAKAFREKKYGKAKALQWLLTHSFEAKLLAVKRVTSNRGAKTPGVDKVTWKTPKKKMNAALSLSRRSYNTLPLRRIYIPKKQKGKLRPLSIPAMKCRAMQALHLLALEPISETIADRNAYGFRPLRSAADAISQCFSALAKGGSAEHILEADIKGCFDNISHDWLLENVVMDKVMLKSWLQAGYIENGDTFSTTAGTPQGGVISPTLLTITLSGLEQAVRSAISNKKKGKVHISVYADDFIITGATKEILEERVMPTVERFLSERGLSLSKEKTKITNISEGFDFLGFNIRKYRGKLIIKPAKESIKRFLKDIRDVIKRNKTAKAENLIRLLNPKIRGWTNYYRFVCSKETFAYVSHNIFQALWRWAKRRHPNKGKVWVKNKYYRREKVRDWLFFAKIKLPNGGFTILNLFESGLVTIRRHTKIKADATPYDPEYFDYFCQREGRAKHRAAKGNT